MMSRIVAKMTVLTITESEPMHYYTLISSILLFAVIIHYINQRFFAVQTTIAITIGALLAALVFFMLQYLDIFQSTQWAQSVIGDIDFKQMLLNGMLGFLLFAGSLTVDVSRLKKYAWEIGTLSLLGTVVSAILVSLFIKGMLSLIGLDLPYVLCLLFGALISPTDPIAVLATLKEVKAPKDLEVKIAGESLFNDGIGLVLFVTFYHLAFSDHAVTALGTLWIFIREALGGLVYGAILGCAAYWLIKPLKDAKLEILITVCIASVGYVFAQHMAISGPLAMVVAGLITGSVIREKGLTEHGRLSLDVFWELIEEVLNAALFLLIGLELISMHFAPTDFLAGVLAIGLVLMARFLSVLGPVHYFKRHYAQLPFTVSILTWGGLRGGLALAMALSLPNIPARDLILVLTYSVVVFSIVVQGLTAKPLVKLSRS